VFIINTRLMIIRGLAGVAIEVNGTERHEISEFGGEEIDNEPVKAVD
jgi:hypothetical protein